MGLQCDHSTPEGRGLGGINKSYGNNSEAKKSMPLLRTES